MKFFNTKKLLCNILTTTALITSIGIGTVAVHAQANTIKGDINADGRLTTNDIKYVEYMATLTSTSAEYASWKDHLYKGDLNDDGVVNQEDISIIQDLVKSNSKVYKNKTTSEAKIFDVNSDGFVDKTDLKYVEYMKTIVPTSAEYSNWKNHLHLADFNKDNSITNADIDMLKAFLNGDCKDGNCDLEDDINCKAGNCDLNDDINCKDGNCDLNDDINCKDGNCDLENDSNCKDGNCDLENDSKDNATQNETYVSDLTLRNGDSEIVSLSEYQGQKVLMVYWATWCKYCKEELALYDDFKESLKANNITLLAVNYGENVNTVKNLMKNNNYNAPLMFDVNRNINRKYRIQGYPTNILLDENGNTLSVKSGALNKYSLQALINSVK